jgi:hypothetical protein
MGIDYQQRLPERSAGGKLVYNLSHLKPIRYITGIDFDIRFLVLFTRNLAIF